MATLDTLKRVLSEKASLSGPKQPLSDTQYAAGFDVLLRGPGWMTYQDFILPQLSRLLTSLRKSRLSVLEVAPGPKSVLGHLPSGLRRRVTRYAAFEPNNLLATSLQEWLCPTAKTDPPLPCLTHSPDIHRTPFGLDSYAGGDKGTSTKHGEEKFDMILFCNDMCGMSPSHSFIDRAVGMLAEQREGSRVVVLHPDGMLHLDGLVCQQTAPFPTGVVGVANHDESLDCLAPYIAGFSMLDVDVDQAIRAEWRKVCRDLGRPGKDQFTDYLLFSAPYTMASFTRHSRNLPVLTGQTPVMYRDITVKNIQANLHCPASIIRPTSIRDVQQCVRWALKHGLGLTVVGGGHSGHCLWSNVVSVDMGAFKQINIVSAEEHAEEATPGAGRLVVVEAGCKAGDIIAKTMAAGLSIPLGSCPSVGAGLWLQGGIGHLAKLHGLTCDSIVGAVVVGVKSGQTLCLGLVPSQHRPIGAVRPENEAEMLWSMKGAGTNFGIVISVTFAAHKNANFRIRNWILPMRDSLEMRLKLHDFDQLVASKLPRNCSADVYLFWDAGQLRFGVTTFESFTTELTSTKDNPMDAVLGPEHSSKTVDSVGLFGTDLYMTEMHGGHVEGETLRFKRTLLLKGIGAANVAGVLVAAVENRPTPFCFVHLLQGGGAVRDVAEDATAFGCRDWDFQCIITGVWLREQDGSETARNVLQWVYKVAQDLLPLSSGTYSADLGPDPRDAKLAAKAFGPNLQRLARLKRIVDPFNVLAYACPLPKAPTEQKLVVLITGDSCAGKDYCAGAWLSVFMEGAKENLVARVVSISDATKQEYAMAAGADLTRLLSDRAYKEQHRPALTRFFQDQVRQRPHLPEDHFLEAVHDAEDVDVLFITGMRDEAPVASFSHLVADKKLVEVRVKASAETRCVRKGCHGGEEHDGGNRYDKDSNLDDSSSASKDYVPDFIFENDTDGDEAAKRFAKRHLLPLVHRDLHRLFNMVRVVPDFPSRGIKFRHVLDISQQPGGLALCSSLLETHFSGDWTKVDAVVCCEVGGLVFASALAARVGVPLALIREAGKLPPSTVSAVKYSSHISSLGSEGLGEKRIEMDRDLVLKNGSVVVVDDVLATGETFCAVLQLLGEAGIDPEHVRFMAVAEFPCHRGRALLRQRGFGKVRVESLLVFDGF